MEVNLKRPTLQFKLGPRCYRSALESGLPLLARRYSRESPRIGARRLRDGSWIISAWRPPWRVFLARCAKVLFRIYIIVTFISRHLRCKIFDRRQTLEIEFLLRLKIIIYYHNAKLFGFIYRVYLSNIFSLIKPYFFFILNIKYLRNLSSVKMFHVHTVLTICPGYDNNKYRCTSKHNTTPTSARRNYSNFSYIFFCTILFFILSNLFSNAFLLDSSRSRRGQK